MRTVNLTPHKIDIHLPDGEIREIAPSGIVARVAMTDTEGDPIDGIPTVKTSYGEVAGLPEPRDGVILVVSMLVASAAPRPDVFSPGPLIRDEDGWPVGCRGLRRSC